MGGCRLAAYCHLDRSGEVYKKGIKDSSATLGVTRKGQNKAGIKRAERATLSVCKRARGVFMRRIVAVLGVLLVLLGVKMYAGL